MAKDKVEELEEKIKQLQARKQKIISQEKQKERNARTKKLVEMGAILSTYFELESKEEALQVAKYMNKFVLAKKSEWTKVEITEEEKRNHKL